MTDGSLRIVSEPNAAPQDTRRIEDEINDFNLRVSGHSTWYPLRIFLRDENGEIRGGVTAGIWGGWLEIQFLWVDEPLRKQGYARKLMLAAEEEGRSHSCKGAHVSTFSFQARPFYEKLGYQVIAEVPDFPRGHTHFILEKSLT